MGRSGKRVKKWEMNAFCGKRVNFDGKRNLNHLFIQGDPALAYSRPKNRLNVDMHALQLGRESPAFWHPVKNALSSKIHWALTMFCLFRFHKWLCIRNFDICV